MALALLSCALTSKSDPWTARYFTPEALRTSRTPPQRTPAGEHLRLRLGRITAAAYLRTTVAYRDKGHELGYYDDERWTEAPSEYLRRALSRTLYEEQGLVHVVSGSAPTLDVELTAFEELRGSPNAARLECQITLQDAGIVLLERTVRVERPIEAATGADHVEAMVTALSQALSDAVREIAEGVRGALEANAEAKP